ncbi:MAG: hypothetical protein ACXWMG_05030 [Candidatus Limnocylindria bacterium]
MTGQALVVWNSTAPRGGRKPGSDQAAAPWYSCSIATVPGQGYRFIPTFSNRGWDGAPQPGDQPKD